MGLLPAPKKPIISTENPPNGGFCVDTQGFSHIILWKGMHIIQGMMCDYYTKASSFCQDQKAGNETRRSKTEQRSLA